MDSPTGVELERLRTVGNTYLPQMADDLSTALTGVRDVATEEQAFKGGLFTNTSQRWFEACKALEDIMWYTEDALRDAGRALIQVADNYAWVDSEAAVRLDTVDGY
jgi:hypothetical protein